MGKGDVCKLQIPHLSPAKPGPQDKEKGLSLCNLWNSRSVKTKGKFMLE